MLKKLTIYTVSLNQKDIETLIQVANELKHDLVQFTSTSKFLELYKPNRSGCIVLLCDADIQKVSTFLSFLRRNAIRLPLILASKSCLFSDAAELIDQGVSEFCQIPFDRRQICTKIVALLEKSRKDERQYLEYVSDKLLYNSLTPREADVFNLLTLGHTNKEVAMKLSVSMSTIEYHRSNIMKKLKVSSPFDMIKIRRNISRSWS